MGDKYKAFQLLVDLTCKLRREDEIADFKRSIESANKSTDALIQEVSNITGKSCGADLVKWASWFQSHYNYDNDPHIIMTLHAIKVHGRLERLGTTE